jgi:hypothetical protein
VKTGSQVLAALFFCTCWGALNLSLARRSAFASRALASLWLLACFLSLFPFGPAVTSPPFQGAKCVAVSLSGAVHLDHLIHEVKELRFFWTGVTLSALSRLHMAVVASRLIRSPRVLNAGTSPAPLCSIGCTARPCRPLRRKAPTGSDLAPIPQPGLSPGDRPRPSRRGWLWLADGCHHRSPISLLMKSSKPSG